MNCDFNRGKLYELVTNNCTRNYPYKRIDRP